MPSRGLYEELIQEKIRRKNLVELSLEASATVPCFGGFYLVRYISMDWFRLGEPTTKLSLCMIHT